jgi:hypothetical protein
MRLIVHVGKELDFFFKEKKTPLSPSSSSRFLQVKKITYLDKYNNEHSNVKG